MPASNKETAEKTRQAYVSLIQDIQNSREELIDPESNSLAKCFDRANALYKNVNSAREQALDSQTLTLISQATVDKLERFHADFKEKHQPIQFVHKLASWLKSETSMDDADDDDDDYATQPVSRSGNQIDWKALGSKVVPFTSQTHSCDFLYGLMDLPQKEKRKVQRQRKETVDPLVVAKEGIDDINQVGKETTKYVEQIYTSLKTEPKRDFYQTLINPDDFGQTVENFFYTSFLVKDGHVRIKDSDSGPVLELASQPSKEDYSEGRADRKQCVVKLDYEFWKKIAEQKKIEESFLPSRDYSSFLKDTEERRKRVTKNVDAELKKRTTRKDEEEEEDEEDEEEEQSQPKESKKRGRRPSSSSQDEPPRKVRKVK